MKKYYFVGICGVSMSSLALFMQSEGNLVRGYDKENLQQLTCKGIEIDNEMPERNQLNNLQKNQKNISNEISSIIIPMINDKI